MLKIIFMGTPDFSIPSADAVQKSGNDLIAVVTQPDRPKGRGKQVVFSPVKKWAEERNIPVFQPVRIKGDTAFLEQIRQLQPDLIVTAAFGQILPKDFLAVPALGCINVHASLLPAYRGASPISQALIDGADRTGISVMYMDAGMDTGNIIQQEEIRIAEEENAGQLHDRLAVLGGQVLSRVLKQFAGGKPEGVPQDAAKATYCSKIEKSMGEIHWEEKASTVRNLVRGLTPWPGAYTFLRETRMKVWKVRKWEYFTNNTVPGTVLQADRSTGLIVACRDGAVRIVELQMPGGRPMSDLDYLKGNRIEVGTCLGRTKSGE